MVHKLVNLIKIFYLNFIPMRLTVRSQLIVFYKLLGKGRAPL